MRNSERMLRLPFRTLSEAFSAVPAEKPFITMWRGEDDIETVTFGDFRQSAQSYAAYFQSLGVKARHTVVLVMPQGIPLMSAFMGAMLLGAVPAILAYPNLKVEPTKYRYGLTGVCANLKAALIVVDRGFPEEFVTSVAANGASRLVRCPGEFLPTGSSDAIDPPRPEDLAFIQHSAGTTGLQKGVALTHAAVLKQISYLAPSLDLSSKDRIYSWLPLYHDMGLIACFMLPLACHLSVVMQAPMDWVMQPRTMLELMSAHRCTLAWIPNFALQFLARRVKPVDCAGLELSCVRTLINCSEPVRLSSIEEFFAAYSAHGLVPTAMQTCYAMAETVFAVTQSDVNAAGPCCIWVDGTAFRKERVVHVVSRDFPGAISLVSSGRRLPGTHIRIVSDAGEDLDSGKVGEIVIRCESMLTGYYNRPDLTEHALRDGWYWSGDLGFMVGEELYVIGRKKDLIIVAGENIHPQDIEEIASAHSAIYEGRVVAFGQYNPSLGTEEIVVVAEVRESRNLENARSIEREVRTAISAELGVTVGRIFIKPPRWIVKSTAGKPARATTREKLLAEHPDVQPDRETTS